MTFFRWRRAEDAALLREYYRWWRVFAWWTATERGCKLGPVTFCLYRGFDARRRWEFCAVVFGCASLVDTGLARLRGL